MARRFHLIRPLFRRLSSHKHSASADSSASDSSDTTAASTAPSPDLPARRVSGKASLPAKLRDKLQTPTRDTSRDRVTSSTTSTPPSLLPVDKQTLPRKAPQQSQHRGSSEESDVAATPKLASAERKHSRAAEPRRRLRKTPPTELKLSVDDVAVHPRVVLEQPSPEAFDRGSDDFPSLDLTTRRPVSGEITLVSSTEDLHAYTNNRDLDQSGHDLAASPSGAAPSLHLPTDSLLQRQSILDSANAEIVTTLADPPVEADCPQTGPEATGLPNMSSTSSRKIWVKRPNASATLVQIKEHDLVDDVRDMILKKYANSLGRTFDAPDMTLRIVTRADQTGHRVERVLGPEEEMSRTLDTHYPGGQTVEEALIIDVPHKRTPRPSPRNYNSYHAMEDLRPQETGTDYFPPMPAIIQPTLPYSSMQPNGRDHHIILNDHPRSISVLNTGHVPPLPSPGGSRRHRAEREHRPKFGRQHTSSPTIITHGAPPGQSGAAAPGTASNHISHRTSNRPRVDSSASEAHHPNGIPAAPPLPTPPAPEAPPTGRVGSAPPTPSVGSSSAHPHRLSRAKKIRRSTPIPENHNHSPSNDLRGSNPPLPSISSMLDGSVPPISVLIVEDNIINLRILEGLMKRLKVRWQTAMNGQIAVEKWKKGGYHLVLMDIQMPIMNGLQATKEIRRLERVNGIGVFSSSTPGSPSGNGGDVNGEANGGHDPENEKLPKGDGLFKSPVIIVALTASSLQSDRHEALAAGCNDFLTKPVNFVWLESKVKEWGCMQALIDFDGWRKWKDYAAKEEDGKSQEQKEKEKALEEKQKVKMEKMAKLQEKQRLRKEEEERKKKEKAAVTEPGLASGATQEAVAT